MRISGKITDLEIRTYICICSWAGESFLGHFPSASLPHLLCLSLSLPNFLFNLSHSCDVAALFFSLQCCSLLFLGLLLSDNSARATWVRTIDETWTGLRAGSASRVLHGGNIEGEFVDRVRMGWLFGWTGGMFGFYVWRLALMSCCSVAFGPVLVPSAVLLM